MKYFLIITLCYCYNLQAQRPHQIGFYIAPLKQSAFAFSNSQNVSNDIKPFISPSIEAGIYYQKKINSKIELQHNIHFGILYHSYKTKTNISQNEIQKNISVDEASYSLGYSPKVIIKPFKKHNKFQIISGLNTKYLFDVSSQNYSKHALQNGVLYEEVLFANGTLNNIIPNEKKWQYSVEIGLNYDVNLYNKRLILKITPFYQHSLNSAYTGIYKYTNGSFIENGNFKNNLNQTGIRLQFGLSF